MFAPDRVTDLDEARKNRERIAQLRIEEALNLVHVHIKRQGGKTGSRRSRNRMKVSLPYSYPCKYAKSCFECPLKDCRG